MRLLKEEIGEPGELVFLDLEGTQLSHETIAIGACKYFCGPDLLPLPGKKIQVFKRLIKPQSPVGGVVTILTGITDDRLKTEGITFHKALVELMTFTKCTGKKVYITFGNQDLNMLYQSKIRANDQLCQDFYDHIKRNWFDMQAFVSRFVHDERHMTFSQPKLLEIYEAKNLQHAHDPLYDAENLMNLFIQVIKRPDITLREFKKNLLTSKDFFIISKPFIDDLCNGKDVSSKDFNKAIEDYLS